MDGQIIIRKSDSIRLVEDWSYDDIDGVQHKVRAIQINSRMFHFGDGENRLRQI